MLIIASITIKVVYDHTPIVYTDVGVRRVLGWLRLWLLAREKVEELGRAGGLPSGPILTGLSRTAFVTNQYNGAANHVAPL